MKLSTIACAVYLQFILSACLEAAGVVRVTPEPLVSVGHLRPAACNGKVLFAGFDQNGGNEPWVTNGTTAGTRRLKDIFPGPRSSDPFGFTPFNSRVYFWAEDGRHGRELWSSDCTEAGTTLVKDIQPGTESGSLVGPDPSACYDGQMAVFQKSLYFFAQADDDSPFPKPGNGRGTGLWKTDGTEAGTVCLARSKEGGVGELAVCGDQLYVFHFAGGICKTNGTREGTTLVSHRQKLRRGERPSHRGVASQGQVACATSEPEAEGDLRTWQRASGGHPQAPTQGQN